MPTLVRTSLHPWVDGEDPYWKGHSFKAYRPEVLLERFGVLCPEAWILKELLRLHPTDVTTRVDFRYWKLKPGQAPAMVGFHYDCVTSKDNPLPEERHTIWHWGTSNCGTLFKGPIVTKPGEVWQYGREKHSAMPSPTGGERWLIRLTNSLVYRSPSLQPATYIDAPYQAPRCDD